MIVFKRKTRMLSLRLSEEEYESIRTNSLANGARSISDYARATLFRVIRGEPEANGNGLVGKMEKLNSDLQELTRQLDQLRQHVGLDGPACRQ